MILERLLLSLEKTVAETGLRHVCKLPDHKSGPAFSSSTVLENQLHQTSLFKYGNCKYLFLPVKLVKIPSRTQDRRVLCPIVLVTKGKQSKLASSAMVHRCVGNQVADIVLPVSSEKQMGFCVILKVTIFESLSVGLIGEPWRASYQLKAFHMAVVNTFISIYI